MERPRWLPVPWQKLIEPARRMAVDHSFKHISEIGEGLEVVELGCGEERSYNGPALAAAVRAREQMVLAAERDRSDGALDRVVIELDAAVIEKAGERHPSGERVADRLSQPAVPGNSAELLFEPDLHRRDQRSRLDVAHVSAVLIRAAADALLDRIERGDAA